MSSSRSVASARARRAGGDGSSRPSQLRTQPGFSKQPPAMPTPAVPPPLAPPAAPASPPPLFPNAGAGCWSQCGGAEGACPGFCGGGNACCRSGFGQALFECGFGTLGCGWGHCCVASPTMPAAPPSGVNATSGPPSLPPASMSRNSAVGMTSRAPP